MQGGAAVAMRLLVRLGITYPLDHQGCEVETSRLSGRDSCFRSEALERRTGLSFFSLKCAGRSCVLREALESVHFTSCPAPRRALR